MKSKLIYVLALVLFTNACSETKKDAEATKAPDTQAEAPPPPPAAPTRKNGLTQEDYDKGLALVVKSDCLNCHKVSEKFVGPAYRDVSNRYTANPDTINMLATKIIKGGVGRWGPIPMTPHPTLPKEDAVQMVKYVLSIE
ncbi:c-type cytochrome [Segetibacter sp. 3557_3]|uniref:c-type cytochrome n=1 Tax=Segetibacter sp. 3557_3 TaxID=2547429 RepID=UPI00105882DA|nr:c-type cytochrome [Segetibacter sp. 3557_3]TDH19949.1 c-type cytochrome [Segetibacter sp. 3557_3]